jgi:hypothetical protein
MPRPKDIEEKLDKIITAWETLAPSKTFGGMTLSQFKEATYPSKEMRGLIDVLQAQMTQAINNRDAADDVTAAKIKLVVAGVRADLTEGPDGALYEAFGYTPDSERKTGLTRKGKKTPDESE